MKKKWIFGVMALGLVLGTYACSGDEASEEKEASTEVTAETKAALEEAKNLETDAIVLDAEVDAFIESLEN